MDAELYGVISTVDDDVAERVIFSSPCRIVTRNGGLKPKAMSTGIITVTRSTIVFTTSGGGGGGGKSTHAAVSSLGVNSSGSDSTNDLLSFQSSNNSNSTNIESVDHGVHNDPAFMIASNHLRSTNNQSQNNNNNNSHGLVVMEWRTEDLYSALPRHVNFRKVGVEIFFVHRLSIFLDMLEVNAAYALQSALRRIVKPSMSLFMDFRSVIKGSSPSFIFQTAKSRSGTLLAEAWANREISNFDYLMQLNSIAGRTYNDLGQYPIFPWILADYSSDELDLSNPKTFRDLKRPIGVQGNEQLKSARARYADLLSIFEEEERSLSQDNFENGMKTVTRTCPPPFHFGSHYSVAGFVIWYLMRLEPFTSLHIELQDGKFDKPDRLFTSIAEAYSSCTSSSADVKELIPEFFYCPEMFTNVNNLDLGTKQDGRKVNDVELPPWAANPHDFIRKHREALESEYVSLNLHHWIDLIFGYKQKPPHMKGGHQV